jgi:hypothetical protein
MSTRTLGLVGILCSPFLAIQLNIYGIFENYKATSMTGALSLIYMTGWLCSIIGLYRLNVAGSKCIGKTILIIQLIFLTFGEIWNLYSIIQPGSSTALYWVLDMFWPISNIFMFATGLTIVFAKRLQGWKRFVTLFVGLWFPVTIVLSPMLWGRGDTTLLIVSLYSIIGWALLGLAVYKSADVEEAIECNLVHS